MPRWQGERGLDRLGFHGVAGLKPLSRYDRGHHHQCVGAAVLFLRDEKPMETGLLEFAVNGVGLIVHAAFNVVSTAADVHFPHPRSKTIPVTTTTTPDELAIPCPNWLPTK